MGNRNIKDKNHTACKDVPPKKFSSCSSESDEKDEERSVHSMNKRPDFPDGQKQPKEVLIGERFGKPPRSRRSVGVALREAWDGFYAKYLDPRCPFLSKEYFEKKRNEEEKEEKTLQLQHAQAIDPTTLMRLGRDLMECHSRAIYGITVQPVPLATESDFLQGYGGNCDRKNQEHQEAILVGQDMFRWKAIILGPKNTKWENAVMELQIDFPYNYPFDPPHVRFMKPTIPPHPNVSPITGRVYIDVLGEKWSPAWCVSTLLLSIQSLLDAPLVKVSLIGPEIDRRDSIYSTEVNIHATRLYIQNREEYDKEVQLFLSRTQWMITIPIDLNKC